MRLAQPSEIFKHLPQTGTPRSLLERRAQASQEALVLALESLPHCAVR